MPVENPHPIAAPSVVDRCCAPAAGTCVEDSPAPVGLSPALIALLRSADGLAFCRSLRAIADEERRLGHVRATAAAHPLADLQRARELGLLRTSGNGGMLRFTDLGYEISNVAKEFANWVDGGRRLPEGVTSDMLAGRRVLDVGCGYGRHLLNFTLHGAQVCGIEFQDTYLRVSRIFAEQQGIAVMRVSRARAEQLPFRSGSFDVVFCRLVLNHVCDIDGTIAEFARVLVPGGQLILIVDPLQVALRRVAASRWLGNGRTVAFALLGLMNTVVLELGGRQLKVRWKGRMHAQHSPAWPSSRWLCRRLSTHGFAPTPGAPMQDRQHPGLYIARGRGARS